MKFHELDYPDCRHCSAKSLEAFSTKLDEHGDVIDVLCLGCKDLEALAQWSKDSRLRTSLTMSAALKTHFLRARLTLARLSRPSHPWECRIAFDGSDEQFPAHIYFPREYDPEGLVRGWRDESDRTFNVSIGSKAKREFRSGRAFRVTDNARRSATGIMPAWDMRWLDVAEASERVHRAAKSGLEPRVWFGGLQEVVRAASISGMRSGMIETETPLGAIELTTFCSAGRCLIQIDTPSPAGPCITLITAEDESAPRMGVQGIDATESDALALLDAITTAWCDGRVTMRERAGVRML